MSYHLRKATKQDIPHLVELRLDFLREVQIDAPQDNLNLYRKQLTAYFQKKMKEGIFVAWLATDNKGVIIATSGLLVIEKPPQLWNPSGKESYIMNMYTVPAWRRKGIGSALLEKLLNESKRRGIDFVNLHATPVGKRLYEKYGFKLSNHYMSLWF